MSCSWDLITLSWTFQKEVLATLYIDSLKASSLLPRFLPYSFCVGRRVWFMCRRCNGCRTARTDVCGWYTSVLRNVLLSWVKILPHWQIYFSLKSKQKDILVSFRRFRAIWCGVHVLCGYVCALHTHDTWLHDSHFRVGWGDTVYIGYEWTIMLPATLPFFTCEMRYPV